MIGSVTNAIEIQMAAPLTINVASNEGGNSAAFFGSIAGNAITIEQAPGLVFFNGAPINTGNVAVGVVTAANQAASAAISANAATIAGTLSSELINVAETFDGEDSNTDENNAAGTGPARPTTGRSSSGRESDGAANSGNAGNSGNATTDQERRDQRRGRNATRGQAPGQQRASAN